MSSSSDCLSSVSSQEDESNTILIHFENTDPARFLKNPSLISYQSQSDFSERTVNDEMSHMLLDLMRKYDELSRITHQLNQTIVAEEIKHDNLTHGNLFQILKFTYDHSPYVMNISAKYMDQEKIIQLIKERYVINQDIFQKLKAMGDLQLSNAALEFGEDDDEDNTEEEDDDNNTEGDTTDEDNTDDERD